MTDTTTRFSEEAIRTFAQSLQDTRFKPSDSSFAVAMVYAMLNQLLTDNAALREDIRGLLDVNKTATSYIHAREDQIAKLKAELEQVKAEQKRALWFIESEGYRRCDSPACNCPYWHGGNWKDRYYEINDLAQEHGISINGTTLLKALDKALTTQAQPEEA